MQISLSPSGIRGLSALSSPYNAVLVEHLKEWPGSRWQPALRQWLIPAEMKEELGRLSKKYGWVFYAGREPFQVTFPGKVSLHPYQLEAAGLAVHEHSWMFNFEMGLGKTAAAIYALAAAKIEKRILIVRPAMVGRTGTWERELVRWWPDHPEMKSYNAGDKEVPKTQIVLTSYQLMQKLPLDGWEAIVLDESHYIANRHHAKRAAFVHEIRKKNPKGYRFALTATPVMTEPAQLYHQLDWLWPTRFGYFQCGASLRGTSDDHSFSGRYCNVEETGWVTPSGNPTYKVSGLNAEHAAELETRLAGVSSRVTKKSVAHLLPPLLTSLLTIDRPRGFDPREITERYLRTDLHNLDSTDFLKAHSVNKVDAVAELATEATANVNRVMVVTYLHETAELLERALNKLNQKTGVKVIRLPKCTTKKRAELLANALKFGKCIVVSPMMGIAEGIDLTPFTVTYFAEYYPSPGKMDQLIGRFHRLNSQEPPSIYFVVIAGSYEERVAAKLIERANAAKKVYESSDATDKLLDAFSDKRSEDDFRNHLFELTQNAPEVLE